MSKLLSVSAIENGTVIDHIKAGQAIRIINLLDIIDNGYRATIGLNLPSIKMGLKDLLKIENYIISEEKAKQIKIFSPDVTINIINEYLVDKKIMTALPGQVEEIFICPNLHCITNSEQIKTLFNVSEQGNYIKLTCDFCEKTFDRNQMALVQT